MTDGLSELFYPASAAACSTAEVFALAVVLPLAIVLTPCLVALGGAVYDLWSSP